ncbi:unnamed protein product [Urochloa humidicola]
MAASLVALLTIPLLSSLLIAADKKKASRLQRSSDGRRSLQPPSPPGGLPLLGRLPHRALASMAASCGPVMLLRLGQVPTVVASSAAAAEEAMKTRDLAFASRPRLLMADRLYYGTRDMVFAPYGERWRQARRVGVLHLLSSRRVQSFRRVREQEAAAMVDRVRRDAAVNLNAVLISYTNAVISRAAFGDDGIYYGGLDGGEKLAKLFADFEELLGTVTVGEFVPWLAWVDTLMGLDARTARVAEEMDALVERVVAEHRRRRHRGRRREAEGDDDHRDFVDVLLDVNEAEEQTGGGGVLFDDVAIKAMVLVIFAAATDTTYTALVWAMAELVNHPHEMRRVQDEVRAAVGDGDHVTEDHLPELRYLKCVIKETLRLHAPLPLLVPHETTEDTELLGYHVPARTRVIVNAWAIARDPAAWERAEEFVPERWFASAAEDQNKTDDDYMFAQDFRFVPFGAGRRGCPGVGFAVPSMELALATLVYHFDWEMPSKLEMDELNGLSVRLKATLNLVAKQWSR